MPRCAWKPKNYTYETSGASKALFIGTADKFSIEALGAANINAKDCAAKDVDIRISGAAKASVAAATTLDIDISGAGKVTYTSNPTTVKQETR
ncbi:MAG: DUF2807 domain-containing protein [Edaphocola sp.]